jgi:hypothetical protein
LEEALAVGRERHLSRRAVKELHAERRLEPRHGLGQRRGRHALLARGGGKAAVPGGLCERDELLQALHALSARAAQPLPNECRQC